MAKKQESKTQEYILKAGYKFHGLKNGERHTYVGGEDGNDRVELPESKFNQMRDRFESAADMKERVKLQKELAEQRKRTAELQAIAEEKGVSIDDLISGLRNEPTTKKPDPSPSVGTPEPAPAGVVPPPVGSTPNPAKK